MKTTDTIIKVAFFVPLHRYFDYKVTPNLKVTPGLRVKVPFGKKTRIGIIVDVCSQTSVDPKKLKECTSVLDTKSWITKDLLTLAIWASQYYQHGLGDIFSAMLPITLKEGKDLKPEEESAYSLTSRGTEQLNKNSKRAPKQLELLKHIKETIQPVRLSHLKQNNHTATTIKAAVENNYITEQKIPITEHILESNILEIKKTLNEEQDAAAKQVAENLKAFHCYLLDGITGSGKTEVYFNLIEKVLAQGNQVLYLVPEISLTPQTITRFTQRFNQKIVCLHSALTNKQRATNWLKASTNEAKIIIGTRSAVFTPLVKPGLIIIDEEHDTSFKQQTGFRYSARDVAIKRASLLDIPIVLGSATPSMESVNNAACGKYQHMVLSKRAGNAALPQIQVLDIRGQKLQSGLSARVIKEIDQEVTQNNQVLIFLNRRGFAPTIMCHDCGWLAQCKQCDARLVYHYQKQHLRCHHCTRGYPLPKFCDSCNSEQLLNIGTGTEKLDMMLAEYFPQTTITRIDRDTTSNKQSLEANLKVIHEGNPGILIGTQMLAKGHHFPNVTLVVIMDGDSGFMSADFRGSEHMGQLLTQVAGRAGRAEKPGRVIIQTHHPENKLLHQLVVEGYSKFSQILLEERKLLQLPPFSFMAIIKAESKQSHKTVHFLEAIKQKIKEPEGIEVLGPMPAPMQKREGYYRAQLIIQANSRSILQQQLPQWRSKIEEHEEAKNVRWFIDRDPVDMF